VNIKQLQQGLDYCGRVEAVRQTYHVFQAKGRVPDLVLRAVEGSQGLRLFQSHRRSGRRLRAGSDGRTQRCHGERHRAGGPAHQAHHGSLQALNILYVLVALNQASIQKAGENRQLFFSVRKQRRAAA
jgi:lysozyme family protein